MKQFQILMLACVACSIGCQSASLMPTGFAQNPFRSLASKTPKEPIPEHVVPRQPKNVSLTEEFAKGEQALQAGNIKQARDHFRLVVRENPNHSGAHHRLAYIADKNGEYASAEIHYLAALRIQPRNADILCDLGYSLLLQERFEDSRRFLEKALTVNPNHEPTLLNLAALVGKQGDRAGALALYRQVVSEEEAQSYVAQLHPHGGGQATGGAGFTGHGTPSRTSSGNNTRSASASSSAETPSGEIRPETKALLEKVARARAGQSTPQDQWDLKNLDPREIPPNRINDLFAHIDSEYDNDRLNAPPISAANHYWDDQVNADQRAQLVEHTQGARPHAAAHNASAMMASAGNRSEGLAPEHRESASAARNHPEAWGAQETQPSSLPGELPVAPRNDARYEAPPMQPERAAYGADPAAAYAPGAHSPGDFNQMPPVSPYGTPTGAPPQQNPAANPAQQQSGQQPYPGSQRLNLIEPAASSSGRQASPGEAVGQPTYEQAMQQALRMGMNAGPGQLFPIQSRDAGGGATGPNGHSFPAIMPPPGVTPGPMPTVPWSTTTPTQQNFWDYSGAPGNAAPMGGPGGLSPDSSPAGPAPYTSGYRDAPRSHGPELSARPPQGTEYNPPREYQRAPRGESAPALGEIQQTGNPMPEQGLPGQGTPGPHGYEFNYRAPESAPSRPESPTAGMTGRPSPPPPVNSAGTIRDWPHSPQAQHSTESFTAPPVQSTPAARNEGSPTPWFQEGAQSPPGTPPSGSTTRPNPALHSHGEQTGPSHHTPRPWPHSPQGDGAGSALHNPRPAPPSGVGQLPQVVPGIR